MFLIGTAAKSDPRPSTAAIPVEVRANVRVVEQLQNLESSFSTMLTRVRRVIAKCDLMEVQFFLNDLLETRKFSNCGSFDSVLHQLRENHVDTFNISYLEILATHLQKREVIKLVKGYKEKMEKFLTETTVTEFHCALTSRVGSPLPEKMAVVTVKIPESMATKRTMKDMEKLAGKAFGPYYKSLVRLNVVAGSILINWFVPKTLTEELVRLSQTNAVIFMQEGVEEVTVAGMVVFSYEEVGN